MRDLDILCCYLFLANSVELAAVVLILDACWLTMFTGSLRNAISEADTVLELSLSTYLLVHKSAKQI